MRIHFAFFFFFFWPIFFHFCTLFSYENKSVCILHRERSFAFLIFNSQQNAPRCSRKLKIISPLDLISIHVIKPSDQRTNTRIY